MEKTDPVNHSTNSLSTFQYEISSCNLFENSDGNNGEDNVMFSECSEDEWSFYNFPSKDMFKLSKEWSLMTKIKKTIPMESTCNNKNKSSKLISSESKPLLIYCKQKGLIPITQASMPRFPMHILSNESTSLNRSKMMTPSTSLSSLSNNLERSMKVSDNLHLLLASKESLIKNNQERSYHIFEETEDEGDDGSFTAPKRKKKGRNVEKACNHCKRSHLKCDKMRPCRRCITTGKVGCKDVQHKPRGRPKLLKG